MNENNRNMTNAQMNSIVEELLAGELATEQVHDLQQAASADHELATAIIDAWTIRNGLDELEPETVSPALQRRLLAIPTEYPATRKWYSWLQPANWQSGASWALGSALAMSLILAIGISRQPSQHELLQARQDIQLALTYLGKSLNQADQVTREELSEQVHKVLANRHQNSKPVEHEQRRDETKSIKSL
jgi:hypothetical protein